jgi:hypothetical protein
MNLQRSFTFALCLLQANVVNGSLTSFVRETVDDLSRVSSQTSGQIDLSLLEDESKRQMNKTVSRELQATQLLFADTFLSQVNRTYAFPQSLDTDCAVGPEVAVGVSYLQVEAIDTENGDPVFANTLRWLFNSLLPPLELLPTDAEMMSPRVVYDDVESRFTVSSTMTDKETSSKIYLAVSNNEGPISGSELDWNGLAIDVFDEGSNVGLSLWAKDVSIAVDATNLYITATMFDTTPETIDEEAIDTFIESRVWVINKGVLFSRFSSGTVLGAIDGSVLNTADSVITGVRQLSDSTGGLKFGPYQLATVNVVSGVYLVAHNDQNTLTNNTEVHVVSLTTTGNNVAVSDQMVSLGNIDNDELPIPDAAQPNSEYSEVRTGGRRVSDAVIHSGSLTITTTIENGDESAVFWATIDVSDFTVSESGSIKGESIATGTSTFHPSLAVSPLGDVVVGYGASGVGVFAGMYASKATSTESNPVTIKGGEDSYENLDGWTYHGEYSGMSPDPSDEGCFWAFNTIARFNDPLEAALLIGTWARGALGVQWGKVCLA